MSVLDEIFASAGSDYKPANNVPPSIAAAVTTNTTGGYKTETNSVASYPTITLNYTPSGEEKGTVDGLPVVHFGALLSGTILRLVGFALAHHKGSQSDH